MGTLDKRVFSRITVFNVVKMQTAMTMNTLGLGLGARPAMRSRVVAAKSAKAIVGTPVVGKPVQMAARRAAVTVRAGGNPEPIVQAPFKGIKDDLAARGPLYIDDFKQGVSPKSLASIFFLFFAALAPAVAFGAVLTSATAGMLGATEVILATAIGGVLYSVLCGQPMSILASTGSVVTYTAILYTTRTQYGLPFFGTYAWIGIWTSIILMGVAITSSSNLVRFFTKFTDETFAALVACIFCVESAKKIIMMFFNPSISSTLAMGSALTFAIGIGCVFAAWIAGNYGFTFEALSLPASLAPSVARPWVTDIMAVPSWVKLAALAPAPACAILLYMDQNITTRLVNASKGLKKPGAYHLDMFWLSLITAVTSICGLPWICASTVHSLTHVKSLTDVKQDPATGREEVTGVTETRWTPLVLNLLIGASILFLKDILGQIPMCVLSGIFFYLGLAAMRGNEFLERVGMTLITDPAKMPSSSPLTESVALPTLKKFTIMQIACLAVMWWIKGSPAAMLFPILIAALGPVRMVAGKAGWFTQEELNALDEQVETDPGYVYQAA